MLVVVVVDSAEGDCVNGHGGGNTSGIGSGSGGGGVTLEGWLARLERGGGAQGVSS